jgi:gliding motility-associated-like protein
VNTSISKSQSLTICEGDFVKIGTRIYTQSGVFQDTVKALAGCDSIITTNLVVTPLSIKRLDTTICENKKLIVNGKTYTQSGIFRETIKRTGACDSVFQVSLTVQPLTVIKNRIVLCPNDPTARLKQAGVYRDTIPLNIGCPQVLETTIIESKLNIGAGADVTIQEGDSIRLNPSVPTLSDIKWQWQQNKALSCQTCPNPYARPASTTIFTVEATDTVNKCTVRDAVTVFVKSCTSVYIPTVFTPNNDGDNDYFTVFASGCVKKIRKMVIFNRWGTMVFFKENYLPNNEPNGWDGAFRGTALPPDVYTYLIELEVGDGKVETTWGDVTLLR